MNERLPEAVVAAWGLAEASVEPITVGLINRTFRVTRGGVPVGVLQRLHPIFRGEVNLDLDAVTRHVEARGMTTPRLVPTQAGLPWLEHEGAWRMLTFVRGAVHTSLRDPAMAHAGGALVARFHGAVSDLEHTFHFVRPGAHDTAQHLARLEAALRSPAPGAALARPVGEAILSHAHRLPPLPSTRLRIIHGDLKISNLLFDDAGQEGVALVDLDTLAHGVIAHELGDALRSWCNPRGESAEDAHADARLFEGAMMGYGAADSAGHRLDADEAATVVPGAETIALELAARFATDAIEDRYFGWDSARYPSRAAHNLARARSQLALADSFARQRGMLERIVAHTLSRP